MPMNRFAADLADPEQGLGSAPMVRTRLAFDQVYEAHFSFVFRNAKRLGVADASVDDVVQEVFVVLYRRLDDYDRRSSIRGWIYGILCNVVREYRRTRRRKESPLCALDPETSTSEGAISDQGPAEVVEQQEAARLLLRMLDTLDDEKREVLVLAELEQMNIPEIAQTLGVNVNTLYSRLKAAKVALVQAYRRETARSRPGRR
jgi:RNA polymerase sigma-70 factor, ECF subfamily